MYDVRRRRKQSTTAPGLSASQWPVSPYPAAKGALGPQILCRLRRQTLLTAGRRQCIMSLPVLHMPMLGQNVCSLHPCTCKTMHEGDRLLKLLCGELV